MSDRFRRTLGVRWRLAITVIPVVAGVALAKILVTEIGAETIELNPLYTGLVAGNIFLLGFLLAGTLSDYKESEKLPVELAASLESISDEMLSVEQATGAPEATAALDHLRGTVTSLVDWLHGQGQSDAVLSCLSGLNEHFRDIEPHTQATYVNRIKTEQNASRRMVLRIESIRETSFVVAGFMVAALTSTLLITVLLFIDVGSLGTDLVLMCTLTFLLTYVLLLIRDLDNPFEYEGGVAQGSAEVSLHALINLADRLGPTASRRVAEPHHGSVN